MAAAKPVAGTTNWTRDGTGFTWDLSKEQSEILDKFIVDAKDHLERIKFPHEPLREAGARFLRARKYDAAAAMAMAEASHKWRDEAKLEDHATVPTEELLGCPVDELNAFYPNVYLPVLDSHFRPVYMERTGRIDVPALMCSTGQEGLLAWHKKQLVTTTPLKLANATKARTDGRVVNSSTTIMDMEGFTMGMLMGATKEYLGKITSMDSDNFPETLGTTLLINTPTIFSVAWGIIKGFIDPRTQAKVKVLGTNYHEALTELMGGPDKVPVEYGGTLVVPGIFASTLNTKAVHAGKKHSVAIRCSAGQGMRVRWISDPADIEFTVVAITGGADKLSAVVLDPAKHAEESGATVVYPKQAHPNSKTVTVQCRVEAADVKEETVFVATWDNSAGWNQRIVRFFAGTLPTEAEAADAYAQELEEHGIPTEQAVKALRERGFAAKASEVEAAAAGASAESSSADSGAGAAAAASAAATAAE
ncbi:hypothetical protein FNF27_01434 [Cafeteria roenbergensis]|uniref:CRAL-TRIO domain-containing protein n=1 Tax=Cafeteria roenbergensis TaxID=33653 RepID=A0A5A8EIJ0_CAFRO|nr:hypothetical protein FNF27_01434 [Cafeteria roenbergensis]